MHKNIFRSKVSLFVLLVVGAILVSQVSKSVNAQGSASSKIPGQYIVVLRDNTQNPQDVANEMAKSNSLTVGNVYTRALKGFSATIPAVRLENIKNDSRVQFVSEDREVSAFAKPTPVAIPQTTPTGISRIQAPLTANKGAGIGIAVLDTGIDLTHPDLKANIVANTSCVRSKQTGNDDNGHGSHVAGTIAALDNGIGAIGVAPQAKLAAVKVLNSSGSGTWSSVICGIDWVTANATQYNIKVANMSLGGAGTSDNNCGNSNNDALHKAICNSTAVGVTYVVAAGNDGANASNSVPASYDDSVITVSALADSDGKSGGLGSATSYGADDTFASFSNFGDVVDLGAPGVNIFSTWKSGGYNTINGTSMATPHVAGAAALYINSHPGSVWSQVRDGLKAVGESVGAGHTDPSGLHLEQVVQVNAL
ncbi:MAG: S8 family peptidase [bacterium]|nr:S8 family peptidase [bacterium]